MRICSFFIIILLSLYGCRSAEKPIPTETPLEPTKVLIETDTPEPTIEPSATSTSTLEPTLSPTPTNPPEIQVISYKVSDRDNMGMVLVPEGEFQMGSEDGWESEQPVHTIFLFAYWIDQTEVSNLQYQSCVEAEACEEPGNMDSFTRDEYYLDASFANYPVINVSWYDAVNYCQWVGRRLPTEAEWEKAARGVDGKVYPWGDGINCELANYVGCVGDTEEVGSYPLGASPYGALDMAGNVWEWVADWYFIGYYGESPLDYPLGPESGAYRVVRGGSWNDYDWYLRTSTRYSYFPDNERVSIGFRCALSFSE